jgi:site-specific recombinase XerD
VGALSWLSGSGIGDRKAHSHIPQSFRPPASGPRSDNDSRLRAPIPRRCGFNAERVRRQLEHQHVKLLLDAKRETPGGAHVFMSSLSVLMQFAVDTGLRPDNPCASIKRPKLSREGIRTWADHEIDQFAKRHAVGTKERLAFELLICTAQRGSDIVRMGPH